MESYFYKVAELAIILLFVTALGDAQSFGRPCEGYDQSEIYCYGDFLKTIQMAKLYPDQKTFVDRPLKEDPNVVLTAFLNLGISGDNLNDTARQQISDFVERNGTELDIWEPADWVANPEFVEGVKDEHLRQWGSDLHSFWKELGRKIKTDVRDNPQRNSMYYVSHPVIFPGGRFKEFYYWDSYWIQRGLLVSGMTETVKGMIQNFLEMVELLGFIPNGGRIYYQRSQPPLLIPMVESYLEATNDTQFIKDNIETLVKEFDFFYQQRSRIINYNDKYYLVCHYNNELTEPRPESFSDDYELVEELEGATQQEKDELYANLKSGAESGWDFSSRWFVMNENESPIMGNLTHTKTRDIIPVELNSFMYRNAVLMEKYCLMAENASICMPEVYKTFADAMKQTIEELMWDEDAGTWFDFDYVRRQKRRYFFPTNIAPLWTGAHHQDKTTAARRTVNYLHTSGATNFPGGLPTSMLQTGQQWDFPNGWAPLQHIVIEALENSEEKSAQELAFKLAEKWVQSNHLAYLQTEGAMFEKYDVSVVGAVGGGGEYDVVVGFGWTNGVILDFLKKYGSRLESLPDLPIPPGQTVSYH